MPQPYIRRKNTTDYIALPEYLKEQARKGLFIKKIKPLWLCFEKGEPAELDYKVIPINTSDELDELNRQTGWKRVLISNSMAIICAPAGTPFPPVDDDQTMLVKLKFMRACLCALFSISMVGQYNILRLCTYFKRSIALLYNLRALLHVQSTKSY